MSKVIFLFVLILGLSACKHQETFLFEVLAPEKSGVSFKNTLIHKPQQTILDYLYFYNGGGVAIGDINNDDLPDLFFVSNQNKNKLYVNQGNLKFKDITDIAGVEGNSDWNTGVAMADVNNDGFLDLYVCAVTGINGFKGKNELFINNGDGTFKEEASAYGLDLQNYSTSAAFFDYDLDGDLDMYLLNHAVHTQDSYANSSARNIRHQESGDKLFRNDGGNFVDVSEDAGVYGSLLGYGLGVAVADFNQDGYPDLYVSNDFHENDYYYLNQQNGTFKEQSQSHFGHQSKFSMGSDVADLNHNGYPEILTLDMLPYAEEVLKRSAGDDNMQLQKLRTTQYDYGYQYSRNMLHSNQHGKFFTETGLLAGIAATDWSWSALFADYDQDGEQDLFITNGIPKRPNDLDFIQYASNAQIKKQLDNTNQIDQKALALMPEAKLKNAFFSGNNRGVFDDKTKVWSNHKPTFSTGAAYGDLDGDGDLDLVTNNINAPATIYVNTSTNNYLKIKPKTGKGIGLKAFFYVNDTLHYRELYPQRGFQSSSQPLIHVGLGSASVIDSVRLLWPDGKSELKRSVSVNQTLDVKKENAQLNYTFQNSTSNSTMYFRKVADSSFFEVTHQENDYFDSDRTALIPYQISDRGPALAVGDIDGNGEKDVFVGNGKNTPAIVFLQNNGTFSPLTSSVLELHAVTEAVSAQFLQLDQDQNEELLIGNGGGEFYGKAKALQNYVYQLNDISLESQPLGTAFNDTSVITSADIDNDGDLDIFVGNTTSSREFGKVLESFILVNDEGNFNQISLGKIGMVRDAVFTDFNDDEQQDLIVIGEWMQPRFFENRGGTFTDQTTKYLPENLRGLWQAIIPFDIDQDGDMDYMLGNFGHNTKFSASANYPMKMYVSDFDENGVSEPVVATQKNGMYYPIYYLDELSKQLVSLTKKKFKTYTSYAGKPIDQVIDQEKLEEALYFEVTTLSSGYLLNKGGSFKFYAFSDWLQTAPVTCFLKLEVDNIPSVLAAGNYFGVTPYQGRFDGFGGALIHSKTNIRPGHAIGLDFFDRAVTQLETITISKKEYLIVGINNNKVQLYAME